VIPDEDVNGLLDAAIFMDNNECNTIIGAARSASGKPTEQILKEINEASKRFGQAVKDKFRK